MSHYKLRVTWEYTDKTLQEFCEFLSEECESYAYCREGDPDGNAATKKYHSHFYLYNLTHTYGTFRNKISAFLGGAGKKEGNSLWSLREMTCEKEGYEYAIEYLAYMMKEPFFYNCGLNPEWCLQAEDRMKLIKKEKRELAKSRRPQLEIFIEKFDELLFQKRQEYPEAKLSVGAIAHFVIQELKDQGKLIRKFQVVALVQTLSLKYVGSYQEELTKMVVDEVTK